MSKITEQKQLASSISTKHILECGFCGETRLIDASRMTEFHFAVNSHSHGWRVLETGTLACPKCAKFEE